MRVLWFANIMMPELAEVLGRTPPVVGGWLPSLLDALRGQAEVQVAVATLDPLADATERHSIKGVVYYCLPGRRASQVRLTRKFVAACKDVVDEFEPDVIHVHGTEYAYGLFTAFSGNTRPSVISIQGLLHVCCRHVGGGLTLADSLDAGRAGLLSRLRFILQERTWTRRGSVERQLIRGNRHFIGRTAWDRAHVIAVSPGAVYYHCDEVMRPPFYATQWAPATAKRHTIFCTAAHSPLKGFHWLLYAMILLREEFPGINVRVAGAPWNEEGGFGYYGKYIARLIEKHDLSRHVTPLPPLAAVEVADEMRAAHVVVIPSLIENSPNSLSEAMLIGTPCVASFTGGIPSLVEDGVSALCFPPGDAAYLAENLRRVFNDEALARRLSTQSRVAASARHNPERIVARQLDIYRAVISSWHGTHT